MTTTTFSAGTVVTSSWLNDVNTTVYNNGLNIVTLGADTTGAADSSAALQAAVTASKSVFVPPGNYNFSTGVTVPADVTIYGLNPENTILNYTGTGAFLTLTSGGYSHLEGISLYGPHTPPSVFTSGAYGVSINGNLTATRCQFRYWHRALNWVADGFYLKFYNCQFVFNQTHGYNLPANNTSFIGCRAAFSDYVVRCSGFDGPLTWINGSIENVTVAAFDLLTGEPSIALIGHYLENQGAVSVVGTGLNAAGYKAATLIQGAWKAVLTTGGEEQLAGWFRRIDVSTATTPNVVSTGNHLIYKLDGGLTDTQYLYSLGNAGHVLICDRAEGKSDVTYTPAATYTPTSFSMASFQRVSGGDPITGNTLDLQATASYDPPSLTTNTGDTTTVSVGGATLGDFVLVSYSLDLSGITLTGWVSSAGVVSVRFQNGTSGTVDLSSGTIRVRVLQK